MMATTTIEKKEKKTKIATKRRTRRATTLLLSLTMLMVIRIDNQVACWPTVELPLALTIPSPSPPSSSPLQSTSLPATFTSSSGELDSDTSRKILGSSVVTSVSVVMNSSDGENNSSTTPVSASASGSATETTAVGSVSINSTRLDTSTPPSKLWSLDADHHNNVDDGRMDNAQLKSNLISSPGNFLNPDKYEFYTFDEAGDLVKRRMTWDEIQGLIAAGYTDGLLSEAVAPMYYNENVNSAAANSLAAAIPNKLHDTHLTASEFQSSDIQNVRKVVESVQNVLKSELAAAASSQSKIVPIAASTASAVKPLSAHLPNWSSLFSPNFLENLDEDAFVDLQHHHLLADVPADTGTTAAASSPSEKLSNETSISTPKTPTAEPVATSIKPEKVTFAQQTNSTAFITTTPLTTQPKLTPTKSATTKPYYFKYSSSSTSERIWPPPNALVTNEKPTKYYFRPSTPTTSASPLSFSSFSHLPPSIAMMMMTTTSTNNWPMKIHSSTAATTTTSKSVLSSENTTVSQHTTSNRDSFTPASNNQLHPISDYQQQTAKIRPNNEAFDRDQSSTTTPANNHHTSYSNQPFNNNTGSATNSNSIHSIDKQKNNATYHQPWSSSSFKNSNAHTEKTSVAWQSVTGTTQLQFTRRNGITNTSHTHSHNHYANNTAATTKIAANDQHGNFDNVKSTNESASSSFTSPPWHKPSISYTATSGDLHPSRKNSGTSSVIASTTTTSTTPAVHKFGPFSSLRTTTSTTTSATITTATASPTSSLSNAFLASASSTFKQSSQSHWTTTTAPAELLVTWTSTNGLDDDDRMENKISHNGQILDSDKLVTEQYVSGSAPTTTSANVKITSIGSPSPLYSQYSRVNSTPEEPFFTTRKTTVWNTFGSDDKSNLYVQVDTKKPWMQTTAAPTQPSTITTKSSPFSSTAQLHHTVTWPSSSLVTTAQPNVYSHRINTVFNNNVESKTVSTIASNPPYHHNTQHSDVIRNSTTSFGSYLHRERPNVGSSSSSTLDTDTTFSKFTKNPAIVTTTSNEMVMQRVPTLDPPNKTLSAVIGDADDQFENSSNLFKTKSTVPSSTSTEPVKNLTQIAVMVNKSNETQATTKNSFINHKNAADMKHRLTIKPNLALMSTSTSPFNHYPASVAAANNYNPSNEDKTQQTVKPINAEFLNDCITSLISHSVSNNDRETWQSLSHNGSGNNVVENASHNNHFPPPHHHQVDDNFDHKNGGIRFGASGDEGKHDYHTTTATNYVSTFSHDQNMGTSGKNKFNSGSNIGDALGASTTTHTAGASPISWDPFQQKVTLPSTVSAAAGIEEKLKENSHIYYYKLPPVNLQPSKASANTLPIPHSPSTTANAYNSPTITPNITYGATRPTNVNEKTYQKITTVVRPSSLYSYSTNELASETNRNDWKENSTSTIATWTTFTGSLHTEARISGSSGEPTSSVSALASASVIDEDENAAAENREASVTALDQSIDTKSSPLDELPISTKRNDDDASASTSAEIKLKSTTAAWTTSSSNATIKRTEPMATPQMVTASLNLSTGLDVVTASTTQAAAVAELSDFRKENILQSNDNVTGDSSDADDESNGNEDDDDEEEEEDEGGNNDDETVNGNNNETNDQKLLTKQNEQDDRRKVDDDDANAVATTKNQRIVNATASTTSWPFYRKTSLSTVTTATATVTANESSLPKDRTRNNIVNVNKHPTTQSQKKTWPNAQTQSNQDSITKTLTVNTSTVTDTPTTKTTATGTLSSANNTTADSGIQFVRVKLENRTAATSDDASSTSSVATPNKHKDEKLKTTVAKNQPSKQGTVGSTAPPTIASSTPATNPVSIFRNGPIATVSANAAGTTTTTTMATNSNTSGGNPTSTAVELHPAPHENMGLEASIAYLGDDVKTFIDLCNELSFKIWATQTGKSLTTSRSIVLSPFALLSTLAMIFLGARGSSSGIMNDFLRLDDMVTFNPHQVFRNVTESAMSAKNNGAANVAFVRQVFSDKTKGNVLEFYKERLQQYYDTYIEEINFNAIGDLVRRRTNLLVKRQTQGRIQDYLRGSSITMKPPLATFTANIFQTDCSGASTEGRDGEMYFVVRPSTRQRRLVPIPAVVYRGGFLAGYEPGLDATAVTLSPESIISTILVLPGQQGQVAPGDGLARLEQRLLESSYRRGAWSRLLRSLLFRHGLEVQIPRFSHKSVMNLTAGLQKMGMGEIFAPDKADLRGINGLLNELHLSDCVQANTFSTCGEESVGARHHVETFPSFGQRAGTARLDRQQFLNESPLSSRPRQARLPDNPRLRFDRPFLYIVRHNPTGMILFIGRFNPRLLP